MRYLVKRLPAFFVLFLLLFVFESRAQEVSTITRGSMAYLGNGSLTVFTAHSFYIVADGLTASGGNEKGASAAMSCNPCALGETLKLNVTITKFNETFRNSATLNGFGYSPLSLSGTEFKLSIAPVVVSEAGLTEGITAHFTMTGKIVVSPFLFPFSVMTRQLEGQGIATVFLRKSTDPSRPGYMFEQATHLFKAPPRTSNRKGSSQPSRPAPVAGQ